MFAARWRPPPLNHWCVNFIRYPDNVRQCMTMCDVAPHGDDQRGYFYVIFRFLVFLLVGGLMFPPPLPGFRITSLWTAYKNIQHNMREIPKYERNVIRIGSQGKKPRMVAGYKGIGGRLVMMFPEATHTHTVAPPYVGLSIPHGSGSVSHTSRERMML